MREYFHKSGYVTIQIGHSPLFLLLLPHFHQSSYSVQNGRLSCWSHLLGIVGRCMVFGEGEGRWHSIVPFDPLSVWLALHSCHGIKVVDCEQFSVVNKLRGLLLLLLLLLNVCSNDRQLTFKGLTTLFHQLERVWGRRTREGRFLSLNVSRRGLSLMHTFWWNEAQKNPPIRGSN